YVISLWWIFNCLTGGQKTKAMWFLFLMFMLISQSTSDLFRGTIIQTLSWDHNLRTLGILAMYVVHVWLLFRMPLALQQSDSQLFSQPEKEKEGMPT
ncbi:MAG: hypothetical protein R3219_08860, partial [Hydrogenovibrio sp.]|nr:hypothetical protein [Hydrogenovibrio sp.]